MVLTPEDKFKRGYFPIIAEDFIVHDMDVNVAKILWGANYIMQFGHYICHLFTSLWFQSLILL